MKGEYERLDDETISPRVKGPIVNNRVRVVAQRHKDIEDSLEVGLGREASGVGIHSAECERASGTGIGVAIVDDLFNETVNLRPKERCT